MKSDWETAPQLKSPCWFLLRCFVLKMKMLPPLWLFANVAMSVQFIHFFPKYFRYFLKTIAKFKLKSFWWKVLNSEWKRGQKIVLRSYSLLLSNYLGWNEDDKSLTSSKDRRWYVYFIFQKSKQCAEVPVFIFFSNESPDSNLKID